MNLRYFLVLLAFSGYFNGYMTANIIKNGAHWAVAAGPTWLFTAGYGVLLSDTGAQKLLGSKDLRKEDQEQIRNILKQKISGTWDTVQIKKLKKELRSSMPEPVLWSRNSLFINPKIFNGLTTEEQNKALIEAGTAIQESQTLRMAAASLIIPFITHYGLALYKAACTKVHEAIPSQKYQDCRCPLRTLEHHAYELNNWLADSAIVKCAINICSLQRYYKIRQAALDKKIKQRLAHKEYPQLQFVK